MPKIKILASDFEGNSYFNTDRGLNGCPIIRAFFREGLDMSYKSLSQMLAKGEGLNIGSAASSEIRVMRMSEGFEPIEDFEAEYELL